MFDANLIGVHITGNDVFYKVNDDKGRRYEKKDFVIRFTQNGKTKNIGVPKDKFFSLCTNGGKWSKIIPFEITLTED